MSATENSEFAVPEVVAENEKEESKEIKATKRPAEVSRRKKYLFFVFFFVRKKSQNFFPSVVILAQIFFRAPKVFASLERRDVEKKKRYS